MRAIEAINLDDGYSQIIKFDNGYKVFVDGDKMLDQNGRRTMFNIKFSSRFKERSANPADIDDIPENIMVALGWDERFGGNLMGESYNIPRKVSSKTVNFIANFITEDTQTFAISEFNDSWRRGGRMEYRGFIIEPNRDSLNKEVSWGWAHPDYDGPGDDRIGAAESPEACMADIDEYLEEYGEY